jgi:hypothetical protein
MLPGRKSDFRAGFRPDSIREASKSVLRPAKGRPGANFEPFPIRIRPQSGRSLRRDLFLTSSCEVVSFVWGLFRLCFLPCPMVHLRTYPMLRNNASSRKSGFRAGFGPNYIRESFKIKIGPPAGLRPAGMPILMVPLIESNPEARFPARKHYSVTQGKRVDTEISPVTRDWCLMYYLNLR